MRVNRFYVTGPLHSNSPYELPADAAHHAHTVLRLGPGAAVVVFDGTGGEFPATVLSSSKKSVVVQTGAFSPADRESSLFTHLAIGISKNERFDQVLQKATELGVSAITPLLTERTEIKIASDRLKKIQQRWRRIVVTACEQCQRNRLPQLHAPQPLTDFVAADNSDVKLILHPDGQTGMDARLRPGRVCLLIGPEGGFSDDECRLAQHHHFAPLALGPRILRTETAPLLALGIAQFLWGDSG